MSGKTRIRFFGWRAARIVLPAVALLMAACVMGPIAFQDGLPAYINEGGTGAPEYRVGLNAMLYGTESPPFGNGHLAYLTSGYRFGFKGSGVRAEIGLQSHLMCQTVAPCFMLMPEVAFGIEQPTVTLRISAPYLGVVVNQSDDAPSDVEVWPRVSSYIGFWPQASLLLAPPIAPGNPLWSAGIIAGQYAAGPQIGLEATGIKVNIRGQMTILFPTLWSGTHTTGATTALGFTISSMPPGHGR